MQRRKDLIKEEIDKIIKVIIFLYLFYLFIQYLTNRQNYWRWVVYGFIVFTLFLLAGIFYRKINISLKKKRLNNLLFNLKNTGQEEYLKNFISRFGLEKTKENGWIFRNYKFNWDRINDLKKFFIEKGIISKEKDIFLLLKFYIQEKEEKLTREFIKKEPQKFATLSGEEFEKLLYRLFEKMGYVVEYIGGNKDQGGDLIINKDNQRILVQAKCYRDWAVGNKVVQEVAAAKNFYNCNKSIIITTSEFTPEAISLAKANNAELIGKKRLQEMLLKYLGESWL